MIEQEDKKHIEPNSKGAVDHRNKRRRNIERVDLYGDSDTKLLMSQRVVLDNPTPPVKKKWLENIWQACKWTSLYSCDWWWKFQQYCVTSSCRLSSTKDKPTFSTVDPMFNGWWQVMKYKLNIGVKLPLRFWCLQGKCVVRHCAGGCWECLTWKVVNVWQESNPSNERKHKYICQRRQTRSLSYGAGTIENATNAACLQRKCWQNSS